jgi:hypothetical protein
MKKLLLSLVLVATLVAFGATQVEAENPATISVTVTLAGLSVDVSQATWTPTGVTGAVASPTITVTNDSSNRTEDLSIICSAGGIWGISGTAAGADTFVMEALGGDLTTLTSIHTLQTLETGLVPTGTVDFTLTFTPPTSSTVGTDSMTVTVNAE